MAISGMDVDPLRFFDMPSLACLTLVEGTIHDIKLIGGRLDRLGGADPSRTGG